MPTHDTPKATKVHIIKKGTLIGTTGPTRPLAGEDLEKERTARRLRAHLADRERYRRWLAGEPEDPELARWHANDEI